MSTQANKKRAAALFQQRQFKAAMQLFERICRENKKDFEAWVYLGITKSALGDSIAAEACLRHAIRLQPTNALAHFNLGCALEANKKYGAAVQAFQQAIRLKPDYFEAWHNLASVLRILGQTSAATGAFKRALALNPHSAETYRGLASTYVTQGKATEAAAVCKQVLALMPEHVSAHSLLLFLSTLYLEDPREIYRIHLQWARQHPVSKLVGWWENTELDANERIRVGYLSPNFYQHSVAYFFEPLIANHDRSRFEIFCYSDVENEDSVTERIREHATVWRDSLNLPDNALAKQIMHDRIHILVDLAGHTTRNRLMVMMQKPAPIQMQYIGYLFSTGIDRIDYWMTDRWTDPQGLSDEVSAETIIRLPRGYLSYQPYQQAPAVSPPPWKRNGYVTFGSFNHVSKISDAAYELWLEVLRNNPDTHLILKNESFLDQPTRKEWLDRFHTSGIHKDRIQLRGITESVVEHLELYSQVDIGLDTMPYNGTTTTCEALWQGVPVITLPGKTHCSRQGLSLLNQVGLSDFIAESQSHFVAIASGFVNRPERISELRSDLRDRMKSSSLCDGTGLTKDVEAAYAAVMAQWRNTVEHRT